MDWTLSCPRYKALDWFKRTWLASKLVYYGQRFQHFGPITATGTVQDCVHSATDGDVCFDLLGDDKKDWHCELTPCQPASVHDAAMSLQIGSRAIVSGIKTFDPPHHIAWKKFAGGGNEIHPVTDIRNAT